MALASTLSGLLLAASHVVDGTSPKVRTARPFVPDSRDIESLRQAAAACKGCDLYKQATQIVFGRGASPAAMMLIGSTFRITRSRGQLLQGASGSSVIATWHPSAVLRAHGNPAEARRMFDELAGDLRLAARHSKKEQ